MMQYKYRKRLITVQCMRHYLYANCFKFIDGYFGNLGRSAGAKEGRNVGKTEKKFKSIFKQFVPGVTTQYSAITNSLHICCNFAYI